ncbi:hypothetical protein Val02_80030 [Virgisporangium aliadipatigenens]|uniref:Uncharacterized protein n=1 Tax=Virgisporangium aliadipatigenens TaxID=741659 RepID=A0A8J4DWH4_9ACTN|nr:hypothetical protein [Virgisporangium aliadipatigenens]GIJ51117.1 hypothetical protein Val02_80030 [Virgisporangium aliadipatigenens]
MTLDEVAARLYALPPEEFTAARDESVRAARAAGDRDLAKRIAGLRRPTVGAWLVNLLAHQRPDLITELMGLAAELRAAQRNLRGGDLRELSVRRRQLVGTLARESRALAVAAGRGVRDALPLAEVEGTLTAALADADVAEQVRLGRLVKPIEYHGFGELPRPQLRLVQGGADGPGPDGAPERDGSEPPDGDDGFDPDDGGFEPDGGDDEWADDDGDDGDDDGEPESPAPGRRRAKGGLVVVDAGSRHPAAARSRAPGPAATARTPGLAPAKGPTRATSAPGAGAAGAGGGSRAAGATRAASGREAALAEREAALAAREAALAAREAAEEREAAERQEAADRRRAAKEREAAERAEERRRAAALRRQQQAAHRELLAARTALAEAEAARTAAEQAVRLAKRRVEAALAAVTAVDPDG